MNEFYILLTIFVLACFIGYFVVWGVTPALYSPLMSVSNAISGIIIIGAVSISRADAGFYTQIWGLAAIFLAAINIFGGFAVSHRMLMMFKKKRVSRIEKEN